MDTEERVGDVAREGLWPHQLDAIAHAAVAVASPTLQTLRSLQAINRTNRPVDPAQGTVIVDEAINWGDVETEDEDVRRFQVNHAERLRERLEQVTQRVMMNEVVTPGIDPGVRVLSYDPATAPMPAELQAQIQPLIPTTRDYLLTFFESFHGREPGVNDLIFINALSLEDKTTSKEAIVNYVFPVVEDEDDLIDLPDSGNLSPESREYLNEINHHERALLEAKERFRYSLETNPLPQISIARIKEDFSDFWDVRISGHFEIELTCKYDCNLSHTFKERAELPERKFMVNLGKYKFKFHLSDLSFISCTPEKFRVTGGISAAHPHVKGHICWGTQNEVAKDAILRKDFKAFSRILFQAITNYNHSSTFCSLLRYKIALGDFEGETTVFKASSSHREIMLDKLPKGIHLSSIYSVSEDDEAKVLLYRRYMPYLNDYLQGNYFKVSKSINESGFIPNDFDPATGLPTYQLVDEAEIARIIEKRGNRMDF